MTTAACGAGLAGTGDRRRMCRSGLRRGHGRRRRGRLRRSGRLFNHRHGTVRLAHAGFGKTTDDLRLSSQPYRASGLIAARAWRDLVDVDAVRKSILERASSLSEESLRQALMDPDGFTPVSLMTSERKAAIEDIESLASALLPSGGRRPIAKDNDVQWDGVPKTMQAATIAHGHLLEFRQQWKADGYSLGDLLYSLPLAPGQKRRMVILDWDRQETGIRQESRTLTEEFSADLSRRSRCRGDRELHHHGEHPRRIVGEHVGRRRRYRPRYSDRPRVSRHRRRRRRRGCELPSLAELGAESGRIDGAEPVGPHAAGVLRRAQPARHGDHEPAPERIRFRDLRDRRQLQPLPRDDHRVLRGSEALPRGSDPGLGA